MTFANDRQNSLVDEKTWVTSWVTHDVPIELPGNIEFGCQEISEKAGTWSPAIALVDLYSISRAEFEHSATSARAPKIAAGHVEILRRSSPDQKNRRLSLEMAAARRSLMRHRG